MTKNLLGSAILIFQFENMIDTYLLRFMCHPYLLEPAGPTQNFCEHVRRLGLINSLTTFSHFIKLHLEVLAD